MQVTRFEGGLGVRLPDGMVAALKLHEGDEIEISVTPTAKTADADNREKIKEMLVRFRKYRGMLPKDFRFDREEANARR